jgi:quercetin dioxygenase-like cupin family protein
MEAAPLFALAKNPIDNLGSGIQRRQLVRGSGLSIDQIMFEAGCGSLDGVHEHKISEASYILSGEFEVQIGNETRRLGAGDSYLIPAGVKNHVQCLKSGSYVLIKALETEHHPHDH